MPLFQGEDLVDVTTPDGRTAKVPQSVASALQLSRLQPMTPPPMAGSPPPVNPNQDQTFAPPGAPLGYDPNATTGSVPQGYGPPGADIQPTDVPQTLPTQNTPDYNLPGKPGALEKAATAGDKVIKKQAAAQAKYAASPEGKLDAARGEVKTQNEEQAQDVVTAAELEGARDKLEANIKDKSNQTLTRLAGEQNDYLAQRGQEETKKVATLAAQHDKFANAKIDREHDHPILASIGILLAGIGAAYDKRQENPAIKIFWEAIDRKVAAQMNDIERMKAAYGLGREDLEEFRKSVSNENARRNFLRSTEAERAARQIEVIGAQTSSPLKQVQAQQLAAQIRQQGAQLGLQSVQQQTESDQKDRQHRQEIGLGYSRLSEDKRQADQRLTFDYWKTGVEQTAAIARAQHDGGDAAAKALIEMSNKNEERGARSRVNNDEILLTGDGQKAVANGQKLLDQAAEIRAKKNPTAEDTARADMLEQKGNEIIGTAKIVHAARFSGTPAKDAFDKTYNAASAITKSADHIANIYDDLKASGKNPRSLASTSPEQAEITSEMNSLVLSLKGAYEMGALDKGLLLFTDKQLGGDVTKLDTGAFLHGLGLDLGQDPEAFKKRLRVVVNNVQNNTQNQLIGTGWKGSVSDLFADERRVQDTPIGKAEQGLRAEETPLETANQARKESKDIQLSGGGAKQNAPGASPLSPQARKAEKTAQNIEESGSSTKLGLSNEGAANYNIFMSAVKSGDPKKAPQAVERLKSLVSTGKPEVVLPLLQNVEQDAPDLYRTLRKSLPPDSPVESVLATRDKAQADLKSLSGGGALDKIYSDPLQKQSLEDLKRRAPVDSKARTELMHRANADVPGAMEALRDVDKYLKTRGY